MKIAFPPGLVAVLGSLLFAVAPVPLQAQATKIFVASFGNDANDGSRGSPKRNFQAAHNAVAAGGQIVVLDTAGYGALNISKGVSITVPPGVVGFITANSGYAVTIGASFTDQVILSGLIIENGGSADNGINVTTIGTLAMRDCVISGFTNRGLSFQAPFNPALRMERCTVRYCGNDGAFVSASQGNSRATLVDCNFQSNTGSGIVFSGAVLATATRCVADNNSNAGFFGNGINGSVTLSECTTVNNGYGLRASAAVVRFEGSTVVNNINAAFVAQFDGAQMLSRGNNTVEGNGTSGTASGTYTAK